MLSRTNMPGRLNNHPNMPQLLRKLNARSGAANIEAFPNQWCGRAFYVPDILSDEHLPYIPAEFMAFRPGPSPDSQQNRDVVYTDSPFEIRVKGMSISRFDPIIPFRRNRNEIIMYSTQKDPEGTDGGGEALGGVVAKTDGIPYIHYDHKKDKSITPDKYYPVPDSKSLVVRSGKDNLRECVNLRFNVIEVDEKSEDLDRTLTNLDQLGGTLSDFTAAVPYLALLTPALSVVGALGHRTLETLAKPDKVLNTDVDFTIAKRDPTYLQRARPGPYLRYGYFIFLAEPVCCKLYLSTNTLRNMRLMVRKFPRKKKGKPSRTGSQAEYVPLLNCDYIIVRVTEPESDVKSRRASIRSDHIKRLRTILSTASVTDPQNLKKSITTVLKEAGMQTGETVQQIWDVPKHRERSESPERVQEQSHNDSTVSESK